MRDGTAAEIVDLALKSKPELIIHAGNLPATTACDPGACRTNQRHTRREIFERSSQSLRRPTGRFFFVYWPYCTVTVADASADGEPPRAKQ
jgi:hypothetical protein